MTELKLYNTLTRKKEVFVPADDKNVRMYVCGPTVYDHAHIGNARPVIVFDVLYRLLRHLYGADHVTYVRNITDLDDKINARAARDFPGMPLNEAIAKVTGPTTAQFHKDVAALGCLQPTHEPRATGHIPGMVAMIQTLIAKGNAYVATGNEGREALFSVASMPDYGQLSKRNLDDQQAGARVAVEAHKKNPADFVLWKESAAGEPGWEGDFSFGGETASIHGRPGWHIECSEMSKAYLGETFDIHGGGLDLIFPHHENEIAQSRCAHGSATMARYWMHNGFLQVEGKKMSKSEGNFVTIHELLETEKFGGRKWPGEVLRLAMLMTHYREPVDFSVRRLEEAENTLSRWRRWIDSFSQEATEVPTKIITTLADDLNTPALFRQLSQYSSEASGTWFGTGEPQVPAGLDERQISGANALRATLNFLGFRNSAAVDDDAKFEIARRLALLASKNFAEADKIRAELLAQGIQLMDYKDPQTGEKKTKWEIKP